MEFIFDLLRQIPEPYLSIVKIILMSFILGGSIGLSRQINNL